METMTGSRLSRANSLVSRYEDTRAPIWSPYHPNSMVPWNQVPRATGPGFCLKVEGLNALGLIGDRAAIFVRHGLKQRKLTDGRTDVESTPGNMGLPLRFRLFGNRFGISELPLKVLAGDGLAGLKNLEEPAPRICCSTGAGAYCGSVHGRNRPCGSCLYPDTRRQGRYHVS